LKADPRAVRKDLPDLTRWMLATGVRIGEALAVSWAEADLVAAVVEID
jgi:integrase